MQITDQVPFQHPWPEAALKNIADVLVGGTPSTLVPSFWGGEIRWMSSGDVHLKQIHDVPGRITNEGLRRSNAKLVDPPAVAIALAGQGKTRGTAGVTRVQLCTNQSVALVKNRSNELDIEYLFHNLAFRYEELRARSAGGGRAGLSKSIIEGLPVPLPEPDEQRKIATILNVIDDTTEKTDRLIVKLIRIRQGLIHDLLARGIDEDNNVRSEKTHKFKDSLLGRVPEEWDIDILRNVIVGRIRNGYFKRPELVGSGYRLINVSDLYQDYGINTERVERVAASRKDFTTNEVLEGDCFFTRSSLVLEGIAQCNILRKLNEPTIFECHVMRVRPNTRRVIPEFFAHWCRGEYARKYFMSVAKQVTMTTIDQGGLYELRMPVPSLSEQERIITSIDAMAQAVDRETRYAQKVVAIKHGLMEDVLTGKVRVNHLLKQ